MYLLRTQHTFCQSVHNDLKLLVYHMPRLSSDLAHVCVRTEPQQR
jgi:hypothetical protein